MIANILFITAVLALIGISILRYTNADQRQHPQATARLVFPRDLTAEQVASFLAGISSWLGVAFVFEVSSDEHGIVHRVSVQADSFDRFAGQLRAAIPGIRIRPEESSHDSLTACELRLTNRSVPLRTDDPAGTSTAILATLSSHEHQGTVVQWIVTPKRSLPLLVSSSVRRSFEDSLSTALTDLMRGRRTVTPDQYRHLSHKVSAPLFQAVVRIGVPSAKDIEHATSTVAAIASVRVAGAQFRRRLLPSEFVGQRIESRGVPTHVWPVLVNATELTPLLAWPLESPIIPGLTLGGTPHLPPSSMLPATGLVIGWADFPGMERPVAVGFPDLLRHLYAIGPTGTGKSTLASSLITQQMYAGYGVCVIDPKGDLVNDLLDRIPLHRENDVIVVDPTDQRPVGINLLDGPENEDDLTADQVVGVFARRFASAWGPRTDDIARAAVLTLLADPTSTLADLPVLFGKPAFRRSLVGKVTDPALAQFWQTFESWSEAERAHNTAPLLNKARAVLMRRPVRAIVGQPSTISLDAVLREGRIVLVNLSVGLLGEEAASLLGGLLFARLWAAVQRRTALAQHERHPFFCTLDEFQTLVTIPTPLADVLALARGYGFGMTLLHQNLSQLPLDIRQAALANCRTKVVFASAATDAAVLAKEFAPWIDPAGLVGLDAFEVVLGASIGTQQVPPCTALTYPPSRITGRAPIIRNASRQRYGRDPGDIESAWRERTDPPSTVTPIGRKRTSS